MSKKEPWNHVGIEIEYTDIIPRRHEELMNFLCGNDFQVTHDASVESPCPTLKDLPIKGASLDRTVNALLKNVKTIGGEIVSPIINTSDDRYISLFDDIFSLLKRAGERSKTTRGSIHVHVNMPQDYLRRSRHTVGILRRAWMMAGYFEWAFFKLGGMGREHRGINMDYIYYRPITDNGPHIVKDGRGFYRPLLVYDEVLGSKTHNEFFVRCGDIYASEGRYHPCRYCWINFRNLYNKERPDLEFRLFNKTMRWDYLYAIIELCKAFVKSCYEYSTPKVLSKLKRHVNSLADGIIDQDAHFEEMINFFGIPIRASLLLRKIWNRSPDPEYDDFPIMCHLTNGYHIFHNNDYSDFFPSILTRKEFKLVRKPNYIDIHVLNNMGMSVYPEED